MVFNERVFAIETSASSTLVAPSVFKKYGTEATKTKEAEQIIKPIEIKGKDDESLGWWFNSQKYKTADEANSAYNGLVQQKNAEKAEKLYDYLNSQNFYKNNVEKNCRSRMNVVFHLPTPEKNFLKVSCMCSM